MTNDKYMLTIQYWHTEAWLNECTMNHWFLYLYVPNSLLEHAHFYLCRVEHC